ncbi:universal stress protein [Halorubrum sp. BOL3-1]|uniref:universal stress protein n=1 Tax=Halorubrum sp. BOL3-1 TaxID=2497325 RepID=UPI001005131B|nr:universal stress protein [Halorubrum sp. BOL3-1]QAU14186.1 universal stress protein [Halorubrum sp. BOL3-1]
MMDLSERLPSNTTLEYDTVLVPADSSECSRAGARHAVRIAREFDATVYAVHAVETGPGFDSLTPSEPGQRGDEHRPAGEQITGEVVQLGEKFGVPVETDLLEGRPAEAIQGYLIDNDIDFVAMGTRGRSNLERHLLGSVTEQIVRTSPVPVLTVHSESDRTVRADQEYTDVLLPTRGGDGSELAVDHAISVARRFDATLHAMYVVDIRSEAAKNDMYGLEELVDKLQTQVTDAVIDRAEEAGVDARAIIQQGTPHSAIQRYTDDNDIDVLVMGTHGRGRVERFLLGSITERMIRTSDIPVVTVRLDEWFSAD